MFFTEFRQSYAMKNLLYIFTTLLILSSCQKGVVLPDENPLFSQRENCEQTDEVKSLYEKDAAKLALELMKHDGVNTSDIQIPADYYQKAMDALMVIYNATEMEARTAVIETYDIHAMDAPKRFMVSLDTAYPWTKNWIHGESKTNNKTIDQLLETNDLEVVEYFNFIETVVLEAKTPLNTDVLITTLNEIGGIKRAEYEQTAGDGNDIEIRPLDDFLEVTYSVGYGDCPSGCRFRSYWQFQVFSDCTVEYVGNFGDPAP